MRVFRFLLGDNEIITAGPTPQAIFEYKYTRMLKLLFKGLIVFIIENLNFLIEFIYFSMEQFIIIILEINTSKVYI